MILEDDFDRGNKPRGSKYSIFKDSGPKSHLGYGLWDQSPEIMGTWTLWENDHRNDPVIILRGAHMRVEWARRSV